jgi:hypothetical protein
VISTCFDHRGVIRCKDVTGTADAEENDDHLLGHGQWLK